MITKISHVTIYVLNQDSAYNFYVNKLGFEVGTDAIISPGNRWLTVKPNNQPDVEIILMATKENHQFSKEAAKHMQELIKNGTFGFGVFSTDDIHATYEELKAKGIEFTKVPNEEFYGIEAIFKDDSGNWFSLTQRKNQ
jgi:catechol 2,3-dioxygenase-like lactoylglutathione lyase family enzyme